MVYYFMYSPSFHAIYTFYFTNDNSLFYRYIYGIVRKSTLWCLLASARVRICIYVCCAHCVADDRRHYTTYQFASYGDVIGAAYS